MTYAEAVTRFPFLASPVHLMRLYRGSAYLPTPKHLWALNKELFDFFAAPGGTWFCCNMPFRHGKSEITSRGFPAWSLLLNPDLRIMVCGHGEDFARDEYGAEIKKIVETFGPELGIKLRPDSKAKGQWKIDGHMGGVACFGPDSGGVGYPADIYLIDDMIRSLAQALSPGEMDKHWNFFKGTVYSRLTNTSKLAVVGTRWSRRDIFARVLSLARKSGKPMRHVRFPGIATEKDCDPNTGRDSLGRTPGEPLWPEQVSLEQLETARKEFGPFFLATTQQAPQEEEDSLLRPSRWPTWTDLGHAYRLNRPNGNRVLVRKEDVPVLVTVDWAYKEKKKADRTAIPVCGLLPDGALLLLHCTAKRFSVEDGPKRLESVCLEWKPALVGMEGHDAMILECRRYKIPEPRQLQHRSKAKVVRAATLIQMGLANRIYAPDEESPWLDDFKEELGAFTGVDDDKDDQVDAMSYMAILAEELRGQGSQVSEPEILQPAPAVFPSRPYGPGF